MEIGYLSQVKAILKSLIISSPAKITISQLNRDYIDFEGECIPFRRLGFKSLDKFLQSISDTLVVTGSGETAYVVPAAIEKSKHIHDMIKQQKKPQKCGKSRSKSVLAYSSRNANVLSTKQKSGYSHNKFQSASEQRKWKGHQLSPFHITNRNVSIKIACVRDVPVNRTHPNASHAALQASVMDIQNSFNKAQQIKHEERDSAELKHPKTTETTPNLHKSRNRKEIERLEELLNTTCHVKTSASPFSNDTQENVNKSTASTKCENDLYSYTSYPTRKSGIRALDEKKSIVDTVISSNKHKSIDLNEAVPEFVLNDPLFRINFPKGTVPFGSKIPSYAMPDNIDVGTCIRIFVSEIHSPSKFWFHMDKTEDDLDVLMKEIENMYTCLEPQELLLPKTWLHPGQVCAVSFNDVWHRAVIVAPPMGDSIKARLVDYGTVAEVKIMKIKYLFSCFAEVPVQAMRGSLSHIKPRGLRWSHDATMYFLSSVNELILFGKISKIDKKNIVFYMVLCDSNGDNVLQINTDLIAKGYALYDEVWQEKKYLRHEIAPL